MSRLSDAERRGAECARAVLSGAEPLAGSPISGLHADGPLMAAMRRSLVASRVPAAVVLRTARLAGAGARADAFAADYAFWRGARRELARSRMWRSVARPPAILMYHAFDPDGGRGSRFVVPARRLDRQLRWLRLTRRRVVPLEEVVEGLRAGRLLPPNLVAITVDDGYRDAAEIAAPVLRRHGAVATVYLVAKALGTPNDWDRGELAGRPLLAASELAANDPELSPGGHSATHPDLTTLSDERLDAEVRDGRRVLARALGRDVRTFAYPHGRHDERVRAVVEAAGYDAAVGIERGLNDPGTDLFRLRRAPVDGDRSLLSFELAVRFGDPDLLARLRGLVRRAIGGRKPTTAPC